MLCYRILAVGVDVVIDSHHCSQKTGRTILVCVVPEKKDRAFAAGRRQRVPCLA